MTILNALPCDTEQSSWVAVALAAAVLLVCWSLAKVRAESVTENRKAEWHETKNGNKEARAAHRTLRELINKGEIPIIVVSSFVSLCPEVTTTKWYAYWESASDDEEYLEADETEPARVEDETDTCYDVIFSTGRHAISSPIFNRPGK